MVAAWNPNFGIISRNGASALFRGASCGEVQLTGEQKSQNNIHELERASSRISCSRVWNGGVREGFKTPGKYGSRTGRGQTEAV